VQDQPEHHWIWVSKKAKLCIGALLRWGLQDQPPNHLSIRAHELTNVEDLQVKFARRITIKERKGD